jgi:hypothetical protein
MTLEFFAITTASSTVSVMAPPICGKFFVRQPPIVSAQINTRIIHSFSLTLLIKRLKDTEF